VRVSQCIHRQHVNEYIVDMLQAPAWQPPLPEEPLKVEPKTEQPGGGHVMSEYERFMAEVRFWSGQHCKCMLMPGST